MEAVAEQYTPEQIANLLQFLTDSERDELTSLLAAQKLTLDQWLRTVSSGDNWDWPHLQHIRKHLDAVTSGECKRLMIFCPPRHGKSHLTTIRYPVYRLEQDPTLRVVIGAYSQTLADEFSRQARKVAATRLQLSKTRNTQSHWETEAGGGMFAVGVGAGVTGRGGNLILIDDPIRSREDADSQAFRDRVYNWYKDDLYTRREPGAAIVIIMTRWHELDLSGMLLEADEESWTVVNLPAYAELDDPLGRTEGEPLCPDRYDAAQLAEIRAVLGERSFSALYQQRPRPADGGVFQRSWFKVIDKAPELKAVVRFWDLAVSTKETSDFTAGALAGIDRDLNFYILDMQHQRSEWPVTKRTIIDTAQRDGTATTIGVENVAFQLAAIQDLRRDPALVRHRIKDVRPDKDKLSRAMLWADKAESGKLFLVRGKWTEPFIEEALSFGAGAKHDDRVDAVSGAVSLLTKPGSSRLFSF